MFWLLCRMTSAALGSSMSSTDVTWAFAQSAVFKILIPETEQRYKWEILNSHIAKDINANQVSWQYCLDAYSVILRPCIK
jgi:hypothetical protein